MRDICVACGTRTERLAVVMDPFMDQSYGVCEECLHPLHAQMWETLQRTLGKPLEQSAAPPKAQP